MPVYSLVSRDPDHTGEIDLWHPDHLTEEEFGELLLEAMRWTSSSPWKDQVLETARYLIDKHGFRDAGGLIRISYPAEWSKTKVQGLLQDLLNRDRSD
jgi:hypothetical protein